MRCAITIVSVAILGAIAKPAQAQNTPPPPGLYSPNIALDTSRVFIDVNVLSSTSSLAGGRTFSTVSLMFGEIASFRASYPRPAQSTRAPLDVGGGYRIRPQFEVGASYARTRYDDGVRVSLTVPHPFYLNASASLGDDSDSTLERTESATNVFVAFRPVLRERVQLRLYGGPSFFSYGADMVRQVLHTQVAGSSTPVNTITIVGLDSEHVSGSTLGFHGGLDVAYFFTRLVGVTGGVRYSYGTVSIDREPLSGLEQQIRVGGVVAVLGARFRFGG